MKWGALALIATSVACYRPCEGPPTQLMGEFRSHMTPAAVAQILGSCKWHVLESAPWSKEDPRPRYDFLKVDVTKCVPIGKATRVEMHFFNDRLAGILLVVQDTKGYLAQLEKEGRWQRGPDGSLRGDKATHVWSAVNWKNEPYVLWEDACLAEESRSWISAYA